MSEWVNTSARRKIWYNEGVFCDQKNVKELFDFILNMKEICYNRVYYLPFQEIILCNGIISFMEFVGFNLDSIENL